MSAAEATGKIVLKIDVHRRDDADRGSTHRVEKFVPRGQTVHTKTVSSTVIERRCIVGGKRDRSRRGEEFGVMRCGWHYVDLASGNALS